MKSQRRCNSGAEIRGHRGYVLAGARATVPTPRTAWRARRPDRRGGVGRVAGRGGGTLVRKRDGAEYTIFARGFLKRRRYVRSLEGGGGDGHGPDAGGAGVCGTPCLAVALHLPREIVGGDDETPVNGQTRWR